MLAIGGMRCAARPSGKHIFSSSHGPRRVVHGALLRNCQPIRQPLSPPSTAFTQRAGSPPSELLSPVNRLPNWSNASSCGLRNP